MTVGALDLSLRPGETLHLARHAGPPADAGGLGTLVYGGPGSDVAARPLHPGPAHDRFDTGQPVHRGQTGRVRWARAGRWCWGAIDCALWDDVHRTPPERLGDAAEAVYRELFEFLQHTGTPHLQRLWNYLPHINRVDGLLERYRHFNLGRQRAMLAAHHAAFEGAPAACALGVHQGPLVLRFLAGVDAPVAIENPRQVSAYHYPRDYGPASPSFSRAALCRAGEQHLALLVSGTASIVGHATVHVGDWRGQLDETLRNLDAVYGAARARCTAPFTLADSHCVIYLREPALADAVLEAFTQAVGPASPAARTAVLLHADVCRSDLLLEIEAHAEAPGQLLGT